MTTTQDNTSATRPAAAPKPAAPARAPAAPAPARHRPLGLALLLAVVIGGGAYAWHAFKATPAPVGLGSGNGRVDATQIDVATQNSGRVTEVLVHEGDFVKPGQVLAVMKQDTLEAQRDEADARFEQAEAEIRTSRILVTLRERDYASAMARTQAQQAELKVARQHLARSESLAQDGSGSIQQRDDDRGRVATLEANIAASQAQEAAAQQAVLAAKAKVQSDLAARDAAAATVAKVDASIDDNILLAPRMARVQSRLAEPGEVLGNGGKVLSMIDLSDVYMTFFVPEEVAGKISLGAEARIALDALPGEALPAKVSFVASTAQFTPKTVETASERQKLMFRVKAKVDRDWLLQHLPLVKTGVPGVAWVKLSPDANWPANLQVKAGESKKESGQ